MSDDAGSPVLEPSPALWASLFAAPTGALPPLRSIDLPTSLDGLRERLARAASRRHRLALSGSAGAIRLAHGEADGLAGVAVDIYGDYAVVHVRSDEALAHRETLLDAVASLGVRGVYVKLHPRQASTLADPRREDVAPREPSRGEAAPPRFFIREHGLAFACSLGDGLATGLYLDQRENRLRIRQASMGKRVLNLFAYTGAFSVCAGAGGAARTVTVDVARSALAQAEENLRRNGLWGDTQRLVADDAIVFLRRAAVRGDRYDLIVLDPPSYATTKSARFVASSDFTLAARSAAAVLAPGGALLACTNHLGTPFAKLRRMLREAAADAGASSARIDDAMPVDDFPAAPGNEPSMKAAWLHFAG